jgi:hypothetical protein
MFFWWSTSLASAFPFAMTGWRPGSHIVLFLWVVPIHAACGYLDSAGAFTIEATMPANTTRAHSADSRLRAAHHLPTE